MNNNLKINFLPGTKLHFIGIGGIGMSGLAHMLQTAGCIISGSDRGINQPENDPIFSPLRTLSMKLFAQDGSYYKAFKPDYIIYSTAIEADNQDFTVAPNIPRVHRSAALATAMQLPDTGKMIAISGSCGKTTVTAWLAETLCRSGADPSFLTGGLVNRFRASNAPGNYYHGTDEYFIFEADESDKSLLAYEPEYALLLNIGTDHYEKDELVRVFSEFARRIKHGLVVEKSVYKMLEPGCTDHLEIKTFSTTDRDCDWFLSDYKSSPAGIHITINDNLSLALPAPGIHNAANALAMIAMFDILNKPLEQLLPEIAEFSGVWRRSDYAGLLASGAKVYDDYAHNVEKIVAGFSALRETISGKLIIIFQPHGFGPLGFMRDELLKALEINLHENDLFAMLPPYYAGGTSSFKPTAQEVIDEFNSLGKKTYRCFANRIEAEKYLNEYATANDAVIIMGARDNSLSTWAAELAEKP
jgi:UDP-N-acetylmuramate--alanine ligase